MNKISQFVTLGVLIIASISCAKETPITENTNLKPEVEKGRKISLDVNIDIETKIDHSLEGTTIKPTWEKGDCILLVHGATKEYLTLVGDGGSASGTFTGTSTIANGDEYYVTYYKNDRSKKSEDMTADEWVTNYASVANWSTQDGTLEHLPEYLSSPTKSGQIAVYPAKATLSSQIIYFHFKFDNVVNSGIARSFGSATLSCAVTDDNHKMFDRVGHYGNITINAKDGEHPFIVKADGTTENMDFYVAFNVANNTATGTRTYKLSFNPNDAVATDLAEYKLTWSQNKAYSRGRIYKPSSILSNTSYSIPQGKRLSMVFTNTTKSVSPGTWNYWVLSMFAKRLRPDNCYYDETLNTWPGTHVYNSLTDWGTDNVNYHSIINGGTISMTIDNNKDGGFAYVKSVMTNTAGSFTESFYHPSTDVLNVDLSGDDASLSMASSSLSEIPNNNSLLQSSIGRSYLGSTTFGDVGYDFISWGNSSWQIESTEMKYNCRWTIPAGEQHTYKMTVTSNGERIYDSPAIEVWNNDWTTCYGDCFLSSHHFGGPVDAGLSQITPETNWTDDAERRNALKSTPTAYVTIYNSGKGTVSVRWSTVYNEDYKYVYYDDMPVPAGDLKYCFASERCQFTLVD